jgi:Ca2+-transporting ATPase
VGVFCSWFMYDKFMGIDLSKDGHSSVTWQQLSNWQSCKEWEGFEAADFSTANGGMVTFEDPCAYFTVCVCVCACVCVCKFVCVCVLL